MMAPFEKGMRAGRAVVGPTHAAASEQQAVPVVEWQQVPHDLWGYDLASAPGSSTCTPSSRRRR